MVDSIEECMKRKKAFLNLFHSAQKDAFLYDLNRMGYDIINAYVDKIGENREILKEEKESFIRCYKCVFVGSILGWLEEDASYDLSTFYEELCKIFSVPVPDWIKFRISRIKNMRRTCHWQILRIKI